ncbi:MFS general substrate transporter [Patellaria atrata CBS 101060]|uniref:MFS general substrate transporter n=1 Tax=Patellaria atrata CBS 101060 TaxID=1346257 RepID=A0A9P4SCG9_9PEZI|nr:MFS general substrate transporter [Patellaria atrata CBS 101060]
MLDNGNSETSPLLDVNSNRRGSETISRDPFLRSLNSNGYVKKVEEKRALPIWRASLIIISIGLLIFLQASNMTMITTTQSTIARDLDAYEEASWFTSAYLIAMSSISPLAGRHSQLFSPRTIFLAATIIVTIGSIITGTSITFRQFIIGRAITGVGAAGVLTVATIIVLHLTTPKRRGLFLGMLNSAMTLGVSLGAVVAGGLEPKIGWHALFTIQGPLAFVAGTCLFLSIPGDFSTRLDSATKYTLSQKLARVDYFGAITLTVSISCLLLAVSAKEVLLTPIIIGFVLLPVFILNEIYIAKEPIIPVTLMKSRGTLLSCLATVGLMMSRWSILFFTPAYAIAVRLWNPAAAGSILIPTNLGFALGGLLAGWIHIRRAGSFYVPSLVTMSLFPVTLALISLESTPTSPTSLYLLLVFTNGFCTGTALNYTLVHLLHLTPPDTHFIVTSLLATFRGFAGSFGSAVGSGVFTRMLRRGLVRGFSHAGLSGKGPLIRKLIGSPAIVGTLHGTERAVAVDAYVGALKGLFYAGVGLSAMVVFIQAGTGWTNPEQETSDEESIESASINSEAR